MDRPWGALAIVATLLAPVVFAPRAAAAQGGGASYTACYVPRSGTVYRVKAPSAPSACTKSDHVEFSWREQGSPGPQGPQGPQGPPGPEGPQGPAGSPGVRAYAYITSAGTLDPARSHGIVSATRPVTGKYCVTPAAGITPDRHPALVSQTDEVLAALSWDFDLIPIGTCAAGQYGISAFSTVNGASTNIGFTIVIP